MIIFSGPRNYPGWSLQLHPDRQLTYINKDGPRALHPPVLGIAVVHPHTWLIFISRWRSVRVILEGNHSKQRYCVRETPRHPRATAPALLGLVLLLCSLALQCLRTHFDAPFSCCHSCCCFCSGARSHHPLLNPSPCLPPPTNILVSVKVGLSL